MHTLITVIHIVTCILIVLVVLVQAGEGAQISASFGGSSQTVFGSSGGANFFERFTQVAAAVFFATSIALTVLSGQGRKSLFDVPPTGGAPAAQTPAAPAQPAAGGNAAAPQAKAPAAKK